MIRVPNGSLRKLVEVSPEDAVYTQAGASGTNSTQNSLGEQKYRVDYSYIVMWTEYTMHPTSSWFCLRRFRQYDTMDSHSTPYSSCKNPQEQYQ